MAGMEIPSMSSSLPSDWSQRSDAGSEAGSSRGRIKHIEVFNFKSYKGQQTIGPFTNFTAVIGPNGAGKSNLMDCISFVMAVKTAQLRGNQLKDLVYKTKEQAFKQAWVKMVYVHGTDGGEETEFHRGITASGSSEYKVKGRSVSAKEYEKELSRIGVLVQVRNFLVFQGEVESLAQTSPTNLTALFEKISGSGALKDEYEKRKANKEQLEEQNIFSMQKKKGLQSEKRQVIAQMEEADKYEELQSEQDRLHTTMYLFDLYHTEHDIATSKKKAAAKRRELKGVQRARAEVDKQVNEARSEAAATRRGKAKITKKFEEAAKKLDEEKRKHIKLETRATHLQGKLVRARNTLKGAETELDKSKSEREGVESEKASLEAQLEGLVAEPPEGDLEMDDDDMQTYMRLKAEADSRSFAARQKLQQVERQQQYDRQELHNLEVSEGEATHRSKSVGTQIETFQERKAKAEQAMQECRSRLAQVQTDRDALVGEEERDKQKIKDIQKDLDRIHQQLRDARIDRREMERNEKRLEMLTTLQRIFTGVHGRVIDLCKPRDGEKDSIAVTVALGKDMDSIVVDTDQTARECVQYIRDQRIGVATFIPMDTIKARQDYDSLRVVGGSSRPLLDVLDFDSRFDRAMRYVCGDTLIFDTIEEARQTCLLGSRRFRGVTLNGTKIDKSGVMTGGISGVERTAQRWNQKNVEKLRKTRDSLEHELSSLTRKSHAERISRLEAEQKSLQDRLQDLRDEVESLDSRLKNLSRLVKVADEQLKRLTPQISTKRAALDSREQQIAEHRSAVASVEDEVFADFSRRMGVARVREHVAEIVSRRTQHAADVARLTKRISQLQSKLDYEDAKDREGPVRKHKQLVDQLASELSGVKASAHKQGEVVDKHQEACNKLQAELEEKVREEKANDVKLGEFKKRGQAEVEKERAAIKQITALETTLERQRTHRRTIINHCQMEDIALPIEDAEDEEMEGEEPNFEQSLASEGFSLSESQAEPSQSQSQALSQQSRQSQKRVQINFRELPTKYRKATKGEIDALKEDLQAQLKQVAEAVDKITPNMKASAKLGDIGERLQLSKSEVEQAQLQAQQATRAFNEVKEKRRKRFMRAFEHCHQQIDYIYKQLTHTPGVNVGGTAFLSLENIDEPYNGGIKFNAMPPMKRFRDMEQLSGGEKTVAALALLFAVHSYHPSPFFVLDEVDAALDQGNVKKVAAYLASRSHDLQCIVISLKDSLYAHADSLVGIYRDQAENCSRTLSLDLNAIAGA